MKEKKEIIKFRLFIYSLILLVLLFFIQKSIVPSGKTTYTNNFSKKNYFISKISPQERITTINEKVNIIGDPVYFSLFTPRSFDKAKVKIKYKRIGDFNTLNQTPIIETGILVDNLVWRYKLKPIENRIIDQVSLIWDKKRTDDILLLQRNNQFSSVEEFLDSRILPHKIALYNHKLKNDFIISEYTPSEEKTTINQSLQGSYQFNTYIKDETLNFNFDFIDLNKNKNSDTIDLHLYYYDNLIASKHLDDDGIEEDTEKIVERGSLGFNLTDLPEGAYKIELRANNDIITKKITTDQKKLSFIHIINLYNEGNEDIEIFTDSHKIQLTTTHPSSIQKFKIQNKEHELSSTYTQYEYSMNNNKKILLQKDGITLSGNGVFAFSEEALINTDFAKVDNNLNIKSGNIDYILSNYKEKKEENGYKIGEAEFNLKEAYQEKGKYSFIISIPGLKTTDNNSSVEIDNISIELSGTSLFKKITNLFK